MSLVKVSRSANHQMCEQLYGTWAHDPRIRKGDLYVTLTMTPPEARGYGADGGWLSWRLCLECSWTEPDVNRRVNRQVLEILLAGALGIPRTQVRKQGMIRSHPLPRNLTPVS